MKLVPYKSCGVFHAGMAYGEVKSRFSDHDEFQKSEFPDHVTSKVMGYTVHVYYSRDGQCEGVEIMKPTYAEWDGIKLGDRPIFGLMSDLREKGIEFTEDTYGIDCRELGIGTYSHDHVVGEDGPINAVYVTFEDDFFDRD